MPLSFKVRPTLPDNRKLAIIRLKQLKRKMDRNPKFNEDYIKFKKNILKDGNMENIDGRPKTGTVWYIPYQAIYHPRKLEKIRVVFDASSNLYTRY